MHEEGGFNSRREAEKIAHKREVEAERGIGASPRASRMTFERYVDDYYWPATEHNLEPTTRAAYQSYLRKHFRPRFGHLPMRRITRPVIQSWVNGVAASGLSPRSIVKYHALLHRIFEEAVRDQVIGFNPCAGVTLPKVVRKPKQIITPAQFDAIMAHVPARYRLFVLLGIETGMRWGELAALRRCDVDTSSDLVHVRRTAVEVPKRLSPTGEQRYIKDYTKNNEHRIVHIDAMTTQLIREHVLANGIAQDALLFTTTAGSIISRNTFRGRVWVPAVTAAELPQHVRFHDLRAAHISWILAGGADIVSTMERVGHRQMSTTQQYVGTLPDSGERALAAFRRVRDR
jgi:integrase